MRDVSPEEQLEHHCLDCGMTAGSECVNPDGTLLSSLPGGCPAHLWRGVERPLSPYARKVRKGA